jgi:hypothetical protein
MHNDDYQLTSTIQVNAALAYVNRIEKFWRLDLQSCRFYAQLINRVRHI